MRLIDMIKMCCLNLWRRKLRTLLTVLGVVIGSCAIVVMISLGLGMNLSLDASLSEMGDLNVITVYPKSSSSGENYYDGGGMAVASFSMSGGGSTGSTEDNGMNDEALEQFKGLEGVSAVTPILSMQSENTSFYGGRNNRYLLSCWDIVAMDLTLLDKFGYKIAQGGGAEVPNPIYFGAETVYQFMDTKKKWPNNRVNMYKADGTLNKPFLDPIEEPSMLLTVNNTKAERGMYSYPSGGRRYEHKMNVAGVLEKDYSRQGAAYGLLMDVNFAKQILEDFNRLNGVKSNVINYDEFRVWVDDINDIDEVQKQIDDMGFSTSSMSTFRQNMQQQLASVQMLLGGLASISLFVAAIGIANTMVMSIYERTREIGVMKVLGCFLKDIRTMFLIEAGCIGLLGGIVGVAMSYGISALMNRFGGGLVDIGGMGGGMGGSTSVSVIPIWLVLLALIFSTFIGIISGYYPANRAVKISALEAIRTDS